MNVVKLIPLICIVVCCSTKNDFSLQGSWTRKSFLSVTDKIKTEGLTKYTFYDNGKYVYKTIGDDIVLTVEGHYKLISHNDSTSHQLLLLIPPAMVNSLNDTIREFKVFEVLKLNEDEMVLLHQTQLISNDSVRSKFYNKKELFVRE
ncbi:hypothetical protein ACFQ21_12810 [Ohtaekwangia kribbensis]|uniref:Lipocalin-like domain-containing protein n=1 Tax=Ohtaekwangia kribbensis TaxID=688913 RepID=A0ABW3K1U0_9BACT